MTPITFEGPRLTPLDAIHQHCLWCCGNSPSEVQRCPATGCKLHPYRLGTIPPGASRALVKVIEAYCQDCMPHGAASCDACKAHFQPACFLWRFRLGRNPNYGLEQREKLRVHGKEKGFQPGSQPRNAPRINPDGGDRPKEAMAA